MLHLTLFAVAAAIAQHRGSYAPAALAWLSVALIAAAGAVGAAWLARRVAPAQTPLTRRAGSQWERWTRQMPTMLRLVRMTSGNLGRLASPAALRAMGVAYGGLQLSIDPPPWDLAANPSLPNIDRLGLAVAFVLAASLWSRFGKYTFWLLLALHAVLAVSLLRFIPDPHIDVVTLHQAGIAALLRGDNPYTMTFANPYHHTLWYPPGFADSETVRSGYTYPPLSLLMATPGYLLGDFRFSAVAVLSAAAGLLAWRYPTAACRQLMAWLLLTPATWLVLVKGWTEPHAVFWLAAAAVSLPRRGAVTALTLGLLAVTKQYMIVPLLAVWISMRRGGRSGDGNWRMLAGGVLAGSLVTAPFLLAAPHAFWRAVVTFHLSVPLRLDALSFIAAAARLGGSTPAHTLGVVCALVAGSVASWGLPRVLGMVLASGGLALLFLCALSPQAFANYYFMVFAWLAIAQAVWESAGSDTAAISGVSGVSR